MQDVLEAKMHLGEELCAELTGSVCHGAMSQCLHNYIYTSLFLQSMLRPVGRSI